MTKEDIKYFANCLKSDKRIDYNTMVDFCNSVIDNQNKLQEIENIMNDVSIGLTDVENTYYCIEDVL